MTQDERREYLIQYSFKRRNTVWQTEHSYG